MAEKTDFDKLSLQIETDGTITPEEAFYDACEILIKHFNLIQTLVWRKFIGLGWKYRPAYENIVILSKSKDRAVSPHIRNRGRDAIVEPGGAFAPAQIQFLKCVRYNRWFFLSFHHLLNKLFSFNL